MVWANPHREDDGCAGMDSVVAHRVRLQRLRCRCTVDALPPASASTRRFDTFWLFARSRLATRATSSYSRPSRAIFLLRTEEHSEGITDLVTASPITVRAWTSNRR